MAPGIEGSIHNPEIKSHARKPTVFNGDQKTLEKFLRDSNIYVYANVKDFPNDTAKSQFLLSYIDGGEAESWKEFYIDTNIKQADGTYKWPKVEDLIKNLRDNFAKEDKVEESLRKLETMKQNGWTAEEIVNEFRILKAQAKIIDDSPLAVRMFWRVLNPSLAMKILTDIDKSNTLEDTKTAGGAVNKHGWFAKAIQYDQIYQDTRATQREDRRGNYNNNDNRNRNFWQAVQKGNERSWRNTKTTPYRDPNAMDISVITTTINTMTYEEWGEYLKKGLCTNCKQSGHLSRDCPKKNPWRSTSNGVGLPNYIRNQPSSGYSKKPDAKEVVKYICAINKEEQDELFEEVKKDNDLSMKGKDFWNGEWQAHRTLTLQIM